MPFPPVIDLGSLDGADGFRIDGLAASNRLGDSVASAGDVNGDGFDDIIVGAPGSEIGGNDSGASYVVFGRAGGFAASLDLAALDGSNGFRLDGPASHGSGKSVASAGDINGDGFDDLIVGSPWASPGGDAGAGVSFVVFGRAGGFAASIDLGALDGADGFRLDGIDPFDRTGTSVASAGDFNGDGFDDLIIGAPDADIVGQETGESYLVFGHAGGFSAALDLSALDGSDGFRLRGIDGRDLSGDSVASAGDVNGDGFDDLIIGAPRGNAAGTGTTTGEAYVVFGHADGFTADFRLGRLDGDDGFRLDGFGSGVYWGSCVSSAGDVNGDGFDDLIVASQMYDHSDGAVCVVFGHGGSFAATLALATLDGSNGFRIHGIDREDRLGSSVASAGDVNGDGIDDLLIGASHADGGGSANAGECYVVFGHTGGFAATLDLATLDGASGFRLDGVGLDSRVGGAVASAGDIDGDGYDDLILGAYLTDVGPATSAGRAFVVFGGQEVAPGNLVEGTDGDDRLRGSMDVDVIEGLGGNDVINGREGGDTMRGGTGDDTYLVDDAADFVVELAASGDDLVRARVDYALGANVENLVLGSAARNGAGNDLANRIFGSGGADVLSGFVGNDILRGGAGRDTLVGGTGRDVIDGGFGADTLDGGDGDDTYQFRDGDMGTTRSLADDIRSFYPGDRISLALVDADVNVASDQAFTWITYQAFSGKAGELRYDFFSHATYVEGDTNGDGMADFFIRISSSQPSLDAGDFLL